MAASLDDGVTENPHFDDATTIATKDNFRPQQPAQTGPKVIIADEDAVEIEEDEPTEETQLDLDQIPEEEGQDLLYQEGLDRGDISLPSIYSSIPGRNRDRFKSKQSPQKSLKKGEPENLFIYKDFDTSLTAVKGNIKKLPLLEQTTKTRGEDLIRDRLLSFNVRNGSLASLDRNANYRQDTMIERSAALKQKKLSESAAVLRKQEHMKTRQSNNMRHKAFWVQNTTLNQSTALPDIKNESSLNLRTHKADARGN